MRKFTVLLLYPDYLAETFGHDTYLAHVAAETVADAIATAQDMARAGRDNDEASDFFPLLCIEGHHDEAVDPIASARPCDSEPTP